MISPTEKAAHSLGPTGQPGSLTELLFQLLTAHRWAGAIMAQLDSAPARPLRFTELLERLEGISRQVLTRTLRGLERDGMIRRTAYSDGPPRAEYAMTDLGRSFCEAGLPLLRWVHEYAPAVEAARRDYDANRRPRGRQEPGPMPTHSEAAAR